MGRRSFGISATQIGRLASAFSAARKAKEREQLINEQNGVPTKQDPVYEISSFDFNPQTRVCHVGFLETTKYRKIERYVTQNYVRYPIYGDWKTKTKNIKKTLKLTNEALEHLSFDQDELVSSFSYEIVSKIDNEDFYPSWFILKTLQNEMKYEIDECKRDCKISVEKANNTISSNKEIINSLDIKIAANNKQINKQKKKIERLQKRIASASKKKHFVLFSILTLGIYAAFHSQSHITRLNIKLEKVSGILSNLEYTNESHSSEIKRREKANVKQDEKIKEFEKQRDLKISSIKEHYYAEMDEIEALPMNAESVTDGGFISLKRFVGITKEKIIGCYVIRNKENGKCYVGQSKDVFKRITQGHFTGTKVKNIIFAEDYYAVPEDKRDDVFEVKIIRCNTKDELDRTERELIEAYDAYGNGYNGTSGNS